MTDSSDYIGQTVSTITSRLLTGVRQQSDSAWHELFLVYHPLVYYWAKKSGLESNDACDVGQEVFMAVQRSISTFEREGADQSFRGWLRKITRNKVADHYRKKKRAEVLVEWGDRIWATRCDEEEPRPTSEEDKILFRTIVDMIRSEFSDEDWKAFWATVIEERAPADVASDLQLTRNQVYLAKSRILKRIRIRLEGSTGDE